MLRPVSLTETLLAASGVLPPSAGHTKPESPLRTTPKRSILPYLTDAYYITRPEARS